MKNTEDKIRIHIYLHGEDEGLRNIIKTLNERYNTTFIVEQEREGFKQGILYVERENKDQ